MYETLEIERAGKVATIWMNRPTVFNAFDEQLIAELATACRELDADPTVRIVVLGGRGKHFSAGADLNWMKRASQFTHEQNVDDARKFAGMLRTLAQMSKPTIARVQGAALGGGTASVPDSPQQRSESLTGCPIRLLTTLMPGSVRIGA